MQKVQSYLYPNRVIIIADLAGFTVENTVVYAKTVKIYKGVDNVIQFDVQNADQKRIDLVPKAGPPSYAPPVSNLQLNVMDQSGKALPNSPYAITATILTGIATVTIPALDIDALEYQYLKYSVTGVDSHGNNIPLYTDSRFSALGKIQLVDNALPSSRKDIIYDRFSGEINYMGNVIYHSSVVSTKFYEAIPTQFLIFTVHYTDFKGQLYIEGTEDSTISVESFKNSLKQQTITFDAKSTGTHAFTVPVGNYNYLRVSWYYPDVWAYSGTGQDPTTVYGSVDRIVVSS